MKKLLIFVAIVAVLVIVGIGILLFNINPIIEKARPEIVKAISKSIGQPVEVGEISAQLFPSVAVKVADVRVKSSQEAQASLAEVGTVIVNTSLSKLLAGQIAVNELSLKDTRVTIRRDADGNIIVAGVNLSRRAQEKAQTATTKAPDTGRKDNKSVVSLSVKHAELSNMRVEWTDEKVSPPQQLSFVIDSAMLADIGSSGTATLELIASALGTSSENIQLNASLNNPVTSLPPEKLLHTMSLMVNKLDLAQAEKLARAYSPDAVALKMSSTLNLSLNATAAGDGAELTVNLDGDAADIVYGDAFSKRSGVPLKLASVAKLDNLKAPKLIGSTSTQLTLAKEKIELPFELKLNESVALSIKATNIELAALASTLPALAAYQPKGSFSSDIKATKSLVKANSAQAPALAGKVTLTELSAALPKKDAAPLPVALQGLTIDASPGADSSTALSIAISSGNAMGFSVGKTNIGASLTPSQVRVPAAQFEFAGGNVNFSTESSLVEPKTFTLSANGGGLNVEQLSRAAMPNSHISLVGTLETFKLSANGNSGLLPQTLSAAFSGNVGKGEIKGFNIVGDSLTKITGIPGLEQSFASFLPEKHRWIVSNNSTAFDRLIVGANVSNSTTNINTLRLEHVLYIVEVNGNAGFDGSLKLDGKLRITPALGEGMVLKQPKLKLLLDENNNLVIPIVISKKGSIPIVVPDVTELAKGAAKNTAKEAIGKELDKVAPGLGGATKLLDKLF